MTTHTETEAGEFHRALAAPERSSGIAACDDAYGWLVGSWDLDVLCYGVPITGMNLRGEAHFAWVLEGRALQDVWILPRRTDRASGTTPGLDMYGTTLRVWDPAARLWRVTYINPVTGRRDELIGRRSGDGIVQLGVRADGTPIRWSFTEIQRDSFRWTGEALESDGVTWKLEGEFRARRRAVS